MSLALISGGGTGIGLATAKYFLDHGWMVAVLGRRKEPLEELARAYPDKVTTFSLDLSQPLESQHDYSKLKKQVIENDAFSALVNNSAVYEMKSFNDSTEEDFEKHFNTNVLGVVRLTKVCWPYLLERKGASVVMVSSNLGLRPIANTSAYSASKSALQSITESLALEGAPKIRVNSICPGIVETPLHGFYDRTDEESQATRKFIGQLHPMGRIGQPEDVAPWIFRLCSKEASWITGSTLKVDGGIHLTSK